MNTARRRPHRGLLTRRRDLDNCRPHRKNEYINKNKKSHRIFLLFVYAFTLFVSLYFHESEAEARTTTCIVLSLTHGRELRRHGKKRGHHPIVGHFGVCFSVKFSSNHTDGRYVFVVRSIKLTYREWMTWVRIRGSEVNNNCV